ncbi:MAG: DUF2163 domain-containing protein [Pseudomonadota bacterium]
MRAFDPAFAAHLQSGATTLATCWRITRRDGFVLGFTDHDRALTFDGTNFLPNSGASGSALASSADLSVDNSDIEGALSADAMSAEDLAAGRYDGASVEVFRVNWTTPAERALLKTGVIGEVSREGSAFRAELRGLSAALDQPHGRVFGRLCDVNLGSAQCGVDVENPAYRTTGAVTALIDDQRFIASGFSSFDDDWFAHGVLTWQTGANAGAAAHIKTQGANGAVSLWLPAGSAIAAGDTFAANAGCDKRFETCRAKFANAVNFRGFHLMPGNDFAVSYPLRGEPNDGGRRR